MDGTTRIATGAITTGITMAGTTICKGVGLAAFMVALGIIAIGKRSYSMVGGASPLFEVVSMLVRFDHVTYPVVNADHSVVLNGCDTSRRQCVLPIAFVLRAKHLLAVRATRNPFPY